MSNDVTVDIPIEDIRAGVRAEIDSALGTVAAQVYEKAKATTAFRDKTGKAAAFHLDIPLQVRERWLRDLREGPAQPPCGVRARAWLTKDGKVRTEHRVPGKYLPPKGQKRRPPHGGRNPARTCWGMPTLWQAPLILKSALLRTLREDAGLVRAGWEQGFRARHPRREHICPCVTFQRLGGRPANTLAGPSGLGGDRPSDRRMGTGLPRGESRSQGRARRHARQAGRVSGRISLRTKTCTRTGPTTSA